MFRNSSMKKARKQLRKYIQASLDAKIPQEDIEAKAKSAGWGEQYIRQIFQDIEQEQLDNELRTKRPRRKLFQIKVEREKPPTQEVQEEQRTEQTGGLSSQVKELNEKFDVLVGAKKNLKDKNVKFPMGVKGKMKTLAQKNKVLCFNLKTNMGADATIGELKNGLLWVNNTWRNLETGMVYLWRGKVPCIFLPEWDLSPIGTKQYYDAVAAGRAGVDAQTVIIKAMEQNKVLGAGTKMSGKMWIFIILGAIVIGYLIFGGGVK